MGINLCFLYKTVGEQQKAVNLVRTLSHIWERREILHPEFFEGKEQADLIRKSIFTFLSVICDKIDNIDSQDKSIQRNIRTITIGSEEPQTDKIPEMINIVSRFILS